MMSHCSCGGSEGGGMEPSILKLKLKVLVSSSDSKSMGIMGGIAQKFCPRRFGP